MKQNYIQYFGHVAGIKIEKKNGEVFWAMIDSDKIALVKNYRWSISSNGYVVHILPNRKTLLLHDLVIGLTPGNGLECDHENSNPLDNRISNLRIVSHRVNSANKGSWSKTGFAGVYKVGKKFQALININGKTKYLGIFDTPEEAHEKFKQEHILVYGF